MTREQAEGTPGSGIIQGSFFVLFSSRVNATNVSWTESPHRYGRNKYDDDDRRRRTTAGGGAKGRRRPRVGEEREAASSRVLVLYISVMVSVQYGPFNTNIPIRSTTIGKSRVARDPITMHTSRGSNSDIACVTRESGESSTTKHRLLHASGPHPIPPPDDPNRVGKRVKVRHLSCRVSMMFRVVRANLYNQDLGLNPLDKW
ncbi:hypothetical protein F511_15216 [Dorcoceras hygrometricum]|uniref:Uncharacterized protein n=1 Tax=Dorcoceras hygrometricum TaxID=472368 RepID=A0A2Z7CE36_9LAMI|nr:hypothetical protein F511_15216 [Dorcoceras hygrometricum]